MTKLYAIQGDVRFDKIDLIPKEAKRKDTLILVYGEATNHAHRILNGEVYEFEKRLFFKTNGTDLVHDEHNTIHFDKGSYEVIRQREITSGDMTKIVID